MKKRLLTFSGTRHNKFENPDSSFLVYLPGTVNWCSLQLISWRCWGTASYHSRSGLWSLFFFRPWHELKKQGVSLPGSTNKKTMATPATSDRLDLLLEVLKERWDRVLAGYDSPPLTNVSYGYWLSNQTVASPSRTSTITGKLKGKKKKRRLKVKYFMDWPSGIRKERQLSSLNMPVARHDQHKAYLHKT